MDLKAPVEEWHDDFKKVKELADVASEEKRAGKEANDPKWKDDELCQPTENWDRKDREGRVGQTAFLLPGSKHYQARYQEIDWSR
jgi:hypothetical protein